MATITSKFKLNTKSIKDKYSTLKEVEDGKTKSQVAAKYGMLQNTLSTWLKIRIKFCTVGTNYVTNYLVQI